jgi:hypothetical protein
MMIGATGVGQVERPAPIWLAIAQRLHKQPDFNLAK